MRELINILKSKKNIPLDQYIKIALYNKKFGYYMKKNPFGKKGDFLTSPLVSNLFAEMIAIWCIAYWENLGKPKKILLVELGAGDGTLCKDLLKTFKKFNEFYNCLTINLLEISSKLKKIQKNKILNEKVKWIQNIQAVKNGPVIFIGNEFFDSLPIKQICIRKNLFFERCVSWSEDEKKIKFVNKKADQKLIRILKNLNLIYKNDLIEYPVNAIKYLEIISKKINKFGGGVLIFDYGYNLNTNKDTLQSVKKHRYINPLIKPSESDITSHVNFKLFYNYLKKKNLNVSNVITQSEFLQKMGILERANIICNKMTFKEKANIFYRLKKLLDEKEMGNLFKVLFAYKRGKKFSLGF